MKRLLAILGTILILAALADAAAAQGDVKAKLRAMRPADYPTQPIELVVVYPAVPTFNEALGADSLVWLAWRFAAVPAGVPPERVRYLEAAIDAALHDRDLIEEYRKTGVIAGAKYLGAKGAADEIERLSGLDREFFTKTGRLAR